jgi:predicted lipid-binding transport protein (Tim44 family)
MQLHGGLPLVRNFKMSLIAMFDGWLVFAIFFVVAACLQHRKNSNMGPQLSNSMHPIRPEKHQEIASVIQTLDPTFDPDHFKNRFQIAFHAIQNAWQNQDMRSVPHIVSDGIHERFSLQIQEQIDEGYRNKMDQIKVQDALFADHF